MAPGGGFLEKFFSFFPVILVIAIFFLFWQYGSANRCIGCVEVTHWGKIEPITKSVSYEVNGSNPGVFEAEFVNTESFVIRITGVSMADTSAANPSKCFIKTVKGVDESRIYSNSSANKSREWVDVLVESREVFEVKAICPTKKSGESFDLKINMTYTINLAGANTKHSLEGRITGPVKYYSARNAGNFSS